MKYKVKDQFLMRKIADDNVVIARGPSSIDFNGVLVLNESCALLWGNMETFKTVEELAQVIAKEYSIEMDIATTDVRKCIDKMLSYEVLDIEE